MRLLVDAHVFLWWADAHPRLSASALAACKDPANTLVLSVASAWELQIKQQLGKLSISSSLEQVIAREQRTNQMELLPVLLPHVFALSSLPPHHRDPFDRILVAQAVAENLSIVSADPILARYPAPVIW
jgi:PIN domain nuclease of toxin-antitoxin system